jgi:hypothetical protein
MDGLPWLEQPERRTERRAGSGESIDNVTEPSAVVESCSGAGVAVLQSEKLRLWPDRLALWPAQMAARR